jgi:hypothetical protein
MKRVTIKKVLYILMMLLLMYVFVSYIEVIAKNNGTYNYSELNFFVIFNNLIRR